MPLTREERCVIEEIIKRLVGLDDRVIALEKAFEQLSEQVTGLQDNQDIFSLWQALLLYRNLHNHEITLLQYLLYLDFRQILLQNHNIFYNQDYNIFS